MKKTDAKPIDDKDLPVYIADELDPDSPNIEAAIISEAADAATGKPPESAIRKAITGAFDACGPTWLTGWMFDPEHPEQACNLVILADGVVVGRGRAELYRRDLEGAGIGDGKHAFKILIPLALFDGVSRQVEIREESTNQLLAGSPQEFSGIYTHFNQINLNGAGIQGSFSLIHEELTVDKVLMFEHGEVVAEGDCWVKTSESQWKEFYVPIPHDLFDGLPHSFAFRSADTEVYLGAWVGILPYSLTPENALLKYARQGMKAAVSNLAGFRYEALTQSIRKLSQHKTFDPEFDLSHTITQLYGAHQTLVKGPNESDKQFLPLTFPKHSLPKVSVVIPVHNKFYVTYHCLASLLVAPNNVTFEVIVVDDGSEDETINIPKLIDGVQYHRHDEAQGFIRACNFGASFANAEYVVLLNNDTEVTCGWLDELLATFEHFDHVGMAGAKLLYPDGRLQEAGGVVWSNANPWNYGRGANPQDPRYCYARQTDYLSGACIMLPTKLWNDIGGFSERYLPAYFEDTDLAFQVRARGFKTVYAPLSQVIHFEGVSNGVSITSGIKRFQEINRPKFKSQWGSVCRENGKEGVDLELNKDRNVMLRALVIDAETPRPDINAGSYAAIQEILMLQALGFKCTFVPMNMAWMGGYTETLQRMGVECIYLPFASSLQEIIQMRGSEFDLFYITRYYVAEQCIDSIREYAPDGKIVLMAADLHFLREMRMALNSGDDEQLATALETRDKELQVMRDVDLVLSYTDVEKAVIQSHNFSASKVAKCPWVCETVKEVVPFEKRADIAFLGGFGHQPNEEAMIWFINNVVPLLSEALPTAKLRIFGSNMTKKLLALAEKYENVVVEGWVANVTDVYSTCRVFIAPLQSGAGIKGKVIAALAHGVPCVLSPIAAEGVSIADGVDALIAETPAHWVSQIASLYDNGLKWSEVSRRALDFAAKHYGMPQGVLDMQAALLQAEIFTDVKNNALTWCVGDSINESRVDYNKQY